MKYEKLFKYLLVDSDVGQPSMCSWCTRSRASLITVIVDAAFGANNGELRGRSQLTPSPYP